MPIITSLDDKYDEWEFMRSGGENDQRYDSGKRRHLDDDASWWNLRDADPHDDAFYTAGVDVADENRQRLDELRRVKHPNADTRRAAYLRAFRHPCPECRTRGTIRGYADGSDDYYRLYCIARVIVGDSNGGDGASEASRAQKMRRCDWSIAL